MSRDTTNSSTTPKPTGLEFLDEYSGHIGTLYNNAMLPLTNVAGADAVTADVVPALPSGGLAIGMKFSIVWAQNNTGAATLNVDGGGAKSIIAKDGSALQAGNLAAGATDLLIYDGSGFVVFSGGTAVGGESGRTVFDVTGTWVNTLPDDTIVMVECWGAGGGGGPGSDGGGGGGGAYQRAYFLAGDIPQTVTITIPSGGAVKQAGGPCWFGDLVVAWGGTQSNGYGSYGIGGGVGPSGAVQSGLFGGSKGAARSSNNDVAQESCWGGAGGNRGGSQMLSLFGGNGGANGQSGERPGGGGGRNAPGGSGRCIITVF